MKEIKFKGVNIWVEYTYYPEVVGKFCTGGKYDVIEAPESEWVCLESIRLADSDQDISELLECYFDEIEEIILKSIHDDEDSW